MWVKQDVPKFFKNMLMVLIPKPNRDHSKIKNHRAIALKSVYLKIVNSLLKSRLQKYLDQNEIFPSTSYGFIKNRSSVNCVNQLIATIKEKQRNGMQITGIFLNLKDASIKSI